MFRRDASRLARATQQGCEHHVIDFAFISLLLLLAKEKKKRANFCEAFFRVSEGWSRAALILGWPGGGSVN